MSQCRRRVPEIKNAITGKNVGKKTPWYKPTQLDILAADADVGDLLEMESKGLLGLGSSSSFLVKHWAVYAGPAQFPGELQTVPHVVHLGKGASVDGDLTKPDIYFQKLVDVVDKSKVRINNTLDYTRVGDSWFLPTTDIQEINKRIMDFGNNDTKYNVVDHNCEHFATYCRYGDAVSQQVEKGAMLMIICSVLTLIEVCKMKNGTLKTLIVACISSELAGKGLSKVLSAAKFPAKLKQSLSGCSHETRNPVEAIVQISIMVENLVSPIFWATNKLRGLFGGESGKSLELSVAYDNVKKSVVLPFLDRKEDSLLVKDSNRKLIIKRGSRTKLLDRQRTVHRKYTGLK